jgi:hypothetical protein
VAVENSENANTVKIISREEYYEAFGKYEPITGDDSYENAEIKAKQINEVGVSEYLEQLCIS